MNKYMKLAVVTGALLSVSACQSTSEPREIESAATNKTEKSVNSLAVYEQSKQTYEQWLVTLKDAKSLKLYSEDHYADLLEAWSEAVDIYEDFSDDPSKATEEYSLFSSGSYAQKFNAEIATVDKQHKALLALKDKADALLADSIAQMDYLNQINAKGHFKSDYSRLANKYQDLFEYVADGDIDDAQTAQAVFLRDAKKLEVKTVLKVNITPLEKEIRQLNNKGFKSLAAISYAQAKAVLASATSSVKANPRDTDLIELSVAKVKFEIAHVTNIAGEVKRLKATDSSKYESVILQMENKLLDISKAVDGSDFRDQPIRVQTERIVDQIEQMHGDNNTDILEKKIAELEATLKQSDESLALSNEQKNATDEKIDLLEKQVKLNEDHVSRLNKVIASYENGGDGTVIPEKAAVAQTKPAEKAVAEQVAEAVEDAVTPTATAAADVTTAVE